MDIPIGFVIRECGCMWYHYGEGNGYILEDCGEKGLVWISSQPEKLPIDQPYTVANGLAVARIFEMLHKQLRFAEVGRDFRDLSNKMKGLTK